MKIEEMKLKNLFQKTQNNQLILYKCHQNLTIKETNDPEIFVQKKDIKTIKNSYTPRLIDINELAFKNEYKNKFFFYIFFLKKINLIMGLKKKKN
jgi:hypothetical protein